MQAKVNVGAATRSLAFSPNGAHLAVGTVTGIVRVLLVRSSVSLPPAVGSWAWCGSGGTPHQPCC